MNSVYFLESTFQFFVLPNFSSAKEAPFFLPVCLARSAEALYEFIQKSDQEYCHFLLCIVVQLLCFSILLELKRPKEGEEGWVWEGKTPAALYLSKGKTLPDLKDIWPFKKKSTLSQSVLPDLWEELEEERKGFFWSKWEVHQKRREPKMKRIATYSSRMLKATVKVLKENQRLTIFGRSQTAGKVWDLRH